MGQKPVVRLLNVPLDELFGVDCKPARGKRGPASQLERNIERIYELPRSKQRFVNEMLEAVLAQASN